MSQNLTKGTVFADNPIMGYSFQLDMSKLQTGQARCDAAISLIKSMFEQLNLSGLVLAAAEDHVSHSLNMEASWNKLAITSGPDDEVTGIRIRSKLEDYNGDKEAQRQDLNSTLGFLNAMVVILGPTMLGIAEASTKLDAQFNPDHKLTKVG